MSEIAGVISTSTATTTRIVDPDRLEKPNAVNAGRWGGWILKIAEQPHLATESPSRPQERFANQPSTVGLICYVRERMKPPFAKRLAKRLEFLVEVSQEEYPHQAPITPQSLQDFVRYLQSVPNLVYPDVVLTLNGNIRAQWREAKTRHFAVEFLGEDDVRFVVFAPDPKHPGKTTRVSGLSSVDSLMELVRPYGVLGWASQSAVINQRLTHQDIAQMVGASREMVSRVMRDLAEAGYIEGEELTEVDINIIRGFMLKLKSSDL